MTRVVSPEPLVPSTPATSLLTPTCYSSPKLEGGPSSKGGHGVFASATIDKGELLVVWGGEVITDEALRTIDPSLHRIIVQVEEDLYLLTSREGPGDWVNHSCEPNAGLAGQIALVAMRQIERGEEVCYDYAMSEGSTYVDFPCCCGSPRCRGKVTGDDWRLSDLRARYQGYFSPYLQRRIERTTRRDETTAERALKQCSG